MSPFAIDVGHADRHQADLGECQQKVEAVVEAAPEVGPQVEPDQPQQHREQHGRDLALREQPAERARGRRARLVQGAGGLHALAGRGLDDLGRRRQAAQAIDDPADQAAAEHPRIDQHRRQDDQPEKRGHGARRQLRHRLHRHLLAADDDRARGRNALAQQLVDQDDEDRAEHRADDPAAAAEDAGAADDRRRDHDQLGAKAGLAVGALRLRDREQAGDHGAQRGDHEGADAHEVGIDAAQIGGREVAAGSIGFVAAAGPGQDHAADQRHDQEHDDLVAETEAVHLADRRTGCSPAP